MDADGRAELDYYRRHTDELAAENVRLDMRLAELRYALEQKRRGFTVLSELVETVGVQRHIGAIFERTLQAIKGMDRSLLLVPTAAPGRFRPGHWAGFDDPNGLRTVEFDVGGELEGLAPLVNRATLASPFVDAVRTATELTCFVCVPIVVDEPIALLISGRMREARPLFPPLDSGDLDTFLAIAGLLSASVRNLRVAVLEEVDRLKTEFFANVSHELRTPLQLTIAPLEQILTGRAGPTSAHVHELAEVMHRNQNRLLELIDQVLDLTKFEAGEMLLRVAVEPDVDAAVADRLAQFRPLAEQRGVDLRVELNAVGAAGRLFVDREKFDRLLDNLVSNALKFTSAGHVAVATAADDTTYTLAVSDTGVGIPADALDAVFDRFRQADAGPTRMFEGTGIGLALVREIALLHGGSADVASTPGIGSTFTVVLPLGSAHLNPAWIGERSTSDRPSRLVAALAPAESGDVEQLNRAAEASLDPALPTVLYVEDNPDLRVYVRGVLAEDCNLFLAVDGFDGLEKARHYRPDLIVSDEMMPRRSGRELLRDVRADAALRGTPMLFVTARDGLDTRVATLDAGADDYLAKPFHEAELRARVNALLRGKAAERELDRLNRRLEAKVEEQVAELVRTGELRRFLPRELASAVLEGAVGAEDGFARRRVTALFADLVGSTALADRVEPEDASAVVNDFLREMTAIAVAHGGTVDKFIGDAVMVVYGIPNAMEPETQARAALRSAVVMREAMERLRVLWRRRGINQPVGVRIGVNTGFCTVGVFGSDLLRSYTAVGTPVNVAARLQGKAPIDGILCGFATHALARGEVRARAVELALDGIEEPVEAFEVLDVVAEGAPGVAAVLTGREREVARLAAQSLTARQIADRLFIGERTVETHIRRVYDKLGVRSKLELITRAEELEL
ncbi:MAG: ATP-binding protein [Sporichthyaceae bacterium]